MHQEAKERKTERIYRKHLVFKEMMENMGGLEKECCCGAGRNSARR